MRAGHALRWLCACTCRQPLSCTTHLDMATQIQTKCLLPRKEISCLITVHGVCDGPRLLLTFSAHGKHGRRGISSMARDTRNYKFRGNFT